MHLLFGRFGVGIYCIDIVTSVTFYLKLASLSKKGCVIFFTESPLKLMGNAFYFILTALSILEIFQFFVRTFWSCRENGLIRKVRLTSKFMASQPGLQTIAIHIWLHISQSKGNQTMKFGPLIDYDKRNILLQKLWRKWANETSSILPSFFIKA